MDKQKIRQMREENQIPFKILGWLVDSHKIDPSTFAGEAMLEDQFGIYAATIAAKYGKLHLFGNNAWKVKTISVEYYEDEPERQ